MIGLRTPYIQSSASDAVGGDAESARQRWSAFRAELATIGATTGAMTHDDVEVLAPEGREAEARAIIARHLPGGAVRWAVRLADGRVVVGPVQGSGGVIGLAAGRERLELAIKRAELGRPTGIYEPIPGHARMFPSYSAFGNGDHVDADLRGAVLL